MSEKVVAIRKAFAQADALRDAAECFIVTRTDHERCNVCELCGAKRDIWRGREWQVPHSEFCFYALLLRKADELEAQAFAVSAERARTRGGKRA